MHVRTQQLDPWRWRIPRQGKMRTEGLVFANRQLMETLRHEEALQQVVNVACLPGIVGPSIAMPDIHWGYGFPIGGVAAFDAEEGVVSPGGVGYDINCGVRLLRSSLSADEITPLADRLADQLYRDIPAGVGSHRSDLRLDDRQERRVLAQGARWAVAEGFGSDGDLDHIEAGGALPGADPDLISARALERGRNQLGTLGSGNHFLEVQKVEMISDARAAERLGIFPGQVTVSIHTGSRGLGYQVCDDFLRRLLQASRRHGIDLPDRQLCCAPLSSDEGKDYLAAMAAAANYAFANRQLIADRVRASFTRILGQGPEQFKLATLYDVCHNIAKWEEHEVAGRTRRLCVHRKGATRAFPAGHPEVPAAYRDLGQPVLIPGDMGRYSYLLIGSPGAMKQSFGSCCHGAGRLLSRHAAKKAARGRNIFGDLAAQGITLRATGRTTVAEEISEAYKDVAEVVKVVEEAGLGKIVARLRPMIVVKG